MPRAKKLSPSTTPRFAFEPSSAGQYRIEFTRALANYFSRTWFEKQGQPPQLPATLGSTAPDNGKMIAERIVRFADQIAGELEALELKTAAPARKAPKLPTSAVVVEAEIAPEPPEGLTEPL